MARGQSPSWTAFRASGASTSRVAAKAFAAANEAAIITPAIQRRIKTLRTIRTGSGHPRPDLDQEEALEHLPEGPPSRHIGPGDLGVAVGVGVEQPVRVWHQRADPDHVR